MELSNIKHRSNGRAGQLRLLSVVICMAAWQLASTLVDSELILPGPLKTITTFINIASRPGFYHIIATSLWRIIASFSMALGIALILGIPAGILPILDDILSTPMRVLRAVPTMGVILLSLIWLDSRGAPYLVCTIVILPLLYGAIVSAIQNIDEQLIELHMVFQIPLVRKLSKFYIPAIIPGLRGGLSAALGLNVKVMIAAEVLSQPNIAIGTAFQIERSQLHTAGVFAWCIVMIVLSTGLDTLLARFVSPKSSSTHEKDKAQSKISHNSAAQQDI